MPQIPDFVPKCVMFLGAPRDRIHAAHDALIGTCFVLARVSPRIDIAHMYVVTARHVLNETAKLTGGSIFIRSNTIGRGATWIETKRADWFTGDGNVDVGVLSLALNPFTVEFSVIPGQCLATKASLSANHLTVELGQEVVMPGLFVSRKGEQRNIPIIRMGTVAALAEEQVWAEMSEHDVQQIDAYLVEIRSIGGLSGSPVILHRYEKGESGGQYSTWALLGLMQGHYEDPFPITFPQKVQYINAGIGVVVPADDIEKVLSLPQIIDIEKKLERGKITHIAVPKAT